MKAVGAVLLIFVGACLGAYTLLQLFRGRPIAIAVVGVTSSVLFWLAERMELRAEPARAKVVGSPEAPTRSDTSDDDVPVRRLPFSPSRLRAASGFLAAPTAILVVDGMVDVDLWVPFVAALLAGLGLALVPRLRSFAGGWMVGIALSVYVLIAF